MRIYTTHRRIAKRLSANDSVKNVTMSKRELSRITDVRFCDLTL